MAIKRRLAIDMRLCVAIRLDITLHYWFMVMVVIMVDYDSSTLFDITVNRNRLMKVFFVTVDEHRSTMTMFVITVDDLWLTFVMFIITIKGRPERGGVSKPFFVN